MTKGSVAGAACALNNNFHSSLSQLVRPRGVRTGAPRRQSIAKALHSNMPCGCPYGCSNSSGVRTASHHRACCERSERLNNHFLCSSPSHLTCWWPLRGIRRGPGGPLRVFERLARSAGFASLARRLRSLDRLCFARLQASLRTSPISSLPRRNRVLRCIPWTGVHF